MITEMTAELWEIEDAAKQVQATLYALNLGVGSYENNKAAFETAVKALWNLREAFILKWSPKS